MRSQPITKLALGGCFLLGVAAAQAQVTPLGVMVRGGVFMPSSGAGGAVGNSWLAAGVEMDVFRVPFLPLPLDPKFTLSADTYSKSGVSAVPILFNLRVKQGRLRFSGGAGVAFADTPGDDSTLQFSYQVSAGYDLPWLGLPLTAELRYFGVQGVGTTLDGFAVTLGFRL